MKKIPEKYEMTEEDIKAAITYWLNLLNNKLECGMESFVIDFKVSRKMADNVLAAQFGQVEVQVVSAVAEMKPRHA